MKRIQLLKAATILFLTVFFLSNIATAQTYHFDKYSVKEGLAQSSVYVTKQDAKGIVWLGTASGLSSFDGNEFVNYTTENGLADGAVKAIHIDSLGVIWIGHTNGGVSRFVDGEIEIVLSMSADVTSFCEDDEGALWVSSFGEGVMRITNPEVSKDEINFKQYKGQEGLSDIVFQVVKIKNGNIYFVTDVGIKNYNYQKEEFKFYKIPNMSAYFQITYVFESANHDQWFGSYNGGLYHYNLKDNSLKIYDTRDGLASNWISTITEDKNNNIWVGTWGGGVSKINSTILTIDKSKGLKDNFIRCISSDREGNVLFGTKENGLLVYKGSQFVSYGVENGLITDQVQSMLIENDKAWVGTNEGISVFDDKTLLKNYTEESGLPYIDVRFIKKDKKGTIWIGTWGGGVMSFNPNTKRFEMNYRINSFMTQHMITALSIDKSNNLWIGTADGLAYYEIDNQLIDGLTQSNGLAGNDISTIYTDSKNVVWVGSKGKGLTKIDGAKISKIKLEQKITPTAIIEDKDGLLWIGTEGKGVLLFDGEKIIKGYTVKNGLLSDYISFLNIDNNNNIWIGSNRGLNKFDVAEQQFSSYDDKMGYVGTESKNNATYKDANGNLWFGTIKGAVKLTVAEESQNELEPLTQITGFTVNLKKREMQKGLELDYRERAIVFSYSSICLTNPNQVNYQVMLEGLEVDWQPITQQTEVTYSPLPPGKYTFKVKASNNNGVWNVQPVTYSFLIIPPLWQRPWFIALLALFVIAGVILFVKVRERNLMHEKVVLEEKVKERTEEVVEKSKEIESKNKDIIDSITYAKRIQDAILPTDEMFTKQLSDTFILFNPKDIVSGDFYWLAEKDNKSLFAAVDCTGHGVPGAFMSIVGYNLLDKIVGEYGITDADKILNELNKGVSQALRQGIDSDKIDDGMDVALCVFDKDTGILDYSGAYNPLYIISKNDVSEIKGEQLTPNLTDENGLNLFEVKADRFPIGSYTDATKKFTKYSFKLSEGDTVYLFSDGYADQFGGEKGKKFRYKQFKQLLLSINGKSMEEQRDVLSSAFSIWKGDLEQIDDVIVIGSRL